MEVEGGEPGSANQLFFNGNLADIRIYDQALDQNAIQALIPEPSTGILVLLGCVALVRRRRRS